jgi:hypothetical protein
MDNGPARMGRQRFPQQSAVNVKRRVIAGRRDFRELQTAMPTGQVPTASDSNGR